MSAPHDADATRLLDDRGYTGHLIRGAPPYALFERAVRDRITDSLYWKEQCFGLNAADLCDRAVELTCVGGTYADGQRPTPFLCLVFKMVLLGLEREIVDEYLLAGGEEWKYLRALAAFYVRLTAERSEEVYERLEPLLEDGRKLRIRNNRGFRLTYVDEFVDDLLVKRRVCGTSLWQLESREKLEDEDRLGPRVSPLQWMVDEEDERDGEAEMGDVEEDDGMDVEENGDDDSGAQLVNGHEYGNESTSDEG